MRTVIVIAVLLVVGCKKEGRKQRETTTPTSPEAVIDGASAGADASVGPDDAGAGSVDAGAGSAAAGGD